MSLSLAELGWRPLYFLPDRSRGKSPGEEWEGGFHNAKGFAGVMFLENVPMQMTEVPMIFVSSVALFATMTCGAGFAIPKSECDATGQNSLRSPGGVW